MKKFITIIMVFLLAGALLTACGSKTAKQVEKPIDADEIKKINVVTTIFPQYDFIRQIAGENVNLTMLLPPGAESHSFDPSPQDIIKIQNSDMFVYVGGDSDDWMNSILDSIDTSKTKIVSLMDLVDTVKEEIVEGMEHKHDHHHHDEDDDHGHSHDFDEKDVKDRPLSDWNGAWASISGALNDGSLGDFVEQYAEKKEVSIDEATELLTKRWNTEYEQFTIAGDTILMSGKRLQYKNSGFEIIEDDHGKSAWFKYEAIDSDDSFPKYIAVYDHHISSDDHGHDHDHEHEHDDDHENDDHEHDDDDHEHEHDDDHDHDHIAHIHFLYGNNSFEELFEIKDWSPTYFDASVSNKAFAESITGHGHDHEHEDEDHDDDHHDHEEEYDEHVWTSPKNAKLIVTALTDVLSEIDANNSKLYKENSEAYIEKLDELDKHFKDIVSNGNRKLMVFADRFPFRYFVDEYNLKYYAAFPGCSTETDTSAATVAFLIDKVNDEHIPVVFHVELSNEKLSDTISEATGAKKLLFHACHNVSKEEFENGATYIDLMEVNAQNLKEALK